MPGEYQLKQRDWSYEYSTMRFPIPEIDGANFDNVMLTLIPNLDLEIPNIVLGNIVSRAVIGRRTYGVLPPPSNVYAQRELKWLVSYYDTVNGKRNSLEIGTAAAGITNPGTDLLDITAGAGLAFKTAFEAVAVSPDGNAVVVYRVRLVGRNI